jgi:hypothetical protein
MRNTASFRRAQALVLTALRHNGPIKSHVLTELCLGHCLIEFTQIGALFSSLNQQRLIEPYANYKRANGQRDGVVWAATDSYPRLTLLAEPKLINELEIAR